MSFLRRYWGLVVVIFLSIFSILPFFHSGFFPMHDDTQVVRVDQMAKALADGQFPVRWVADLGYGYGYPIFNFYSPLPYYVGGFFNLIGFDALVATKIMFALGILLSGIFMYLLAKEFWGQAGGIVSGLFYIYVPYHAVNIYVRGAVGEFWAMAFLPLMVWGFYKVTVEPRSAGRWVVVGALGLAGLILSHNLTALMTIPLLVILLMISFYFLFKKKNLFTVYYLLFTLILGLSLTASYWLPAIFEAKYTWISQLTTGGSDFRLNFVCLSQLWNSSWGFGGSIPGCIDGMSFKIGKLHILAGLLSLIPLIFWWRKEKLKSLILLLSTFYLLLSGFLTTEYSKPIWEALRPMSFIQYPWRFLVLVAFFLSFISGAAEFWLKNVFWKIIGMVILTSGLLFFNIKYFAPQEYLNLRSQDYLSEENIKWKTSKISDEYLPADFPRPKNKEGIVREKIVPGKGVSIQDPKVKTQKYTFEAISSSEGEVLVKTASFPGWWYFLDDYKTSFQTRDGQILLAVPPGKHKIELVLGNTFVRNLGNFLSFLAVGALFLGGFYGRKIKT